MKRTHSVIYRSIALLLAALLLGGLVWTGFGLERAEPEPGATAHRQEIIPEAETPLPGETESTEPAGDEEPPEETQPPEEIQPTQPQQETEPTQPQEAQTETQPPVAETLPGELIVPDGPETGGNGEVDSDGQGETVPAEGEEEDDALRIITDLANCEITYNQLTDDTLPFYAYIINGSGMSLKVKLRNSATAQNGDYLTGNGKDYQARLCRGETNYFTLYIKQGSVTIQEVTYAVRYVAQKADAEHPTIGDDPPAIQTNLEGVTELSNRNFTLTVEATAYTGVPLTSSNIEVTMDGKRITQPTGGPQYEYQLYFPDPDEGDITDHFITVRAWDNEGNSAYKSYNITYRFVDTGDVIGTAYIVLDATTVGLGILDETYTYKIRQNVPASYAVLEMLEAFGYEASYSGTADVNFYLQRIYRGGLMDYAHVPDNLWAKILRDGLNLTGQYDTASLGEFDYAQGSGWMYSINGSAYAGKGLSNYFLTNGDTIYLRFTLAYGKDIGGYGATGGGYGTLATYCGRWVNGGYIDQHQWQEAAETQKATCTQAGEISSVCAVCGDRKDAQPIEPLGHDFQQTERKEPADGSDGYILYKCTRCEEEKKEVLPWQPLPEDTEPTEPGQTQPTEPEETEPTAPPPETEPEPTTQPTTPPATEPAAQPTDPADGSGG